MNVPIPPSANLDACWIAVSEAQVHGDIRLQDDVESLVADPSFKGTRTGDSLVELSCAFGFPLRWHCGFVLEAGEVPHDFRGPAMPTLARRIAREGMVDAATIGRAEAALNRLPDEWRDWGSRDETLQHLKRLWHVLVHYGVPVRGQD